MYFRFVSAMTLVVTISLAGTALEKRNLELRRAISRQHYQLEALVDRHALHRMEAHELGAPEKILETLKKP